MHLLSCPRVIESLVRRSGVEPGDLLIDFGAGPGTLTAPLASTGSAALAIGRDDAFARTPRRRFTGRPAVPVVHADLRDVRLPRREFAVVWSIPFAVSTPLLRRLLSPTPVRLAAVDAAHLPVRRRSGMDGQVPAVLWTLPHAAYRRPAAPARRVLGEVVAYRFGHRVLREAGADPPAPASSVHMGAWVRGRGHGGRGARDRGASGTSRAACPVLSRWLRFGRWAPVRRLPELSTVDRGR